MPKTIKRTATAMTTAVLCGSLALTPSAVASERTADAPSSAAKVSCGKTHKISKKGGAMSYKRCFTKDSSGNKRVRVTMKVKDTRMDGYCQVGSASSTKDGYPFGKVRACGKNTVKKGTTRWYPGTKAYVSLKFT